LGATGHENGYELKTIDGNLDHKIDNILGPLESLNANDFVEDYIPFIKRESTYMVSDPPHDNHEADHFMYSFVDSQENMFANQSIEEKIDTPSFFLLYDIVDVANLIICDEYDDDYEVDLLEHQNACSPPEKCSFSAV
jgi:hypothetical protein